MLIPLSVVLVVIDQISKWLVVENLKGETSKAIINNILSFTYVENRGAAFGIFNNSRFLLLFISIIIMGFIVYLIINSDKYFESKIAKLILIIILSGAIGNMIDRIFIGYVVDFIELEFIDFAIFNIADIYVSVGGISMMIITMIDSKGQKK